MRTLKPRNLNLKFQTFKAHNRKYLPYPKLVRDATLYFRTAKRANGMSKISMPGSQKKCAGRHQLSNLKSHLLRSVVDDKATRTSRGSSQLAYCIWLCWLLVRKIDIDRLAIFPLHRIDYFPFSKLDYRNKTQYSHRQEGECMMDEMVERLMHVELVLEFKQVEFVLN